MRIAEVNESPFMQVIEDFSDENCAQRTIATQDKN